MRDALLIGAIIGLAVAVLGLAVAFVAAWLDSHGFEIQR